MPKGTVTSVEELPLVLTMRHVQAVMGCARDVAYRLPHIKGFPVVRLGKSLRVPRDAFLKWLDDQARAGDRNGH
jgi:hypothetical protein